MPDLPTAALAYKTVTFRNMMAHDGGSDADNDLQVWRPDLPSDWSYLGQSWSTNDTAPNAIIVRALETDALRDITSWERVWADVGSGKSWNFALWRGIPPTTTTPKSGGYPAPEWIQKNGIKAIRRDLVVEDSVYWVWDDNGVGADRGGSVWRTRGSNGISPNVIIPIEGHGQAPQDICFSLNRSKVIAM
ncbi:FDS protein [Hymenopellis radicata]|nr:FDS protein [Hymenopellis radicata]